MNHKLKNNELLSKFGYNSFDSEQIRENSLLKAIVMYGPKDLISKLKDLNDDNPNVKSDIKWIKKKILKSHKKSHKKSPKKINGKSRKKSIRKKRKSKKL